MISVNDAHVLARYMKSEGITLVNGLSNGVKVSVKRNGRSDDEIDMEIRRLKVIWMMATVSGGGNLYMPKILVKTLEE